MEFVLHC